MASLWFVLAFKMAHYIDTSQVVQLFVDARRQSLVFFERITMQRFVLSLLVLLVAKTFAIPNKCIPFTKDATSTSSPDGFPITFFFGIPDDQKNTGETVYGVPLTFGSGVTCCGNSKWNTDLYLDPDLYMEDTYYDYFLSLEINSAPLMGGKNFTTYALDYVRTASFTCSNNNQTITWGPAYPDFRSEDVGNTRAQFPHLETYVQISAPNTTSYIRYIAFITNKSAKEERLNLNAANRQNYGVIDYPPFNDGRYVASYPWLDSDPGENPDIKANFAGSLTSIHARGPNARDKRFETFTDDLCTRSGLFYAGEIAAGETKAVMMVYSFSKNKTAMLERAAWVDYEPAELFHGLTADQLAQIANWGACQAVLGPDVQVTVTPPPSCSNGLTSDFTVQVTTTRNDLADGFQHRVVLTQAGNDIEIVPVQSEATLAVLNDFGQVKHQLWYKGCLVTETPFTACVKTAPSPQATPVTQTPTGKTSTSTLVQASTSLFALSVLLLQTSTTMRLCVFVTALLVSNAVATPNVCYSFTKDMTTNEFNAAYPVEFYFGENDNPANNGEPLYYVPMYWDWYLNVGTWNSHFYFVVEEVMRAFFDSLSPVMINSVPVNGGFNWTTDPATYVRTANFECSNNNQTFMWGPAYPDMRLADNKIRSQYQHLETYIQVSAPQSSSYIRYVIFVTNKSDKPEKLRVQVMNYANNGFVDISPLNKGRYIASYPWLDSDPGQNPAEKANYVGAVITSTHARGPNARNTGMQIRTDNTCNMIGAGSNDLIAAGETMAFMIVYSFSPNKTRMLERAAWVDSEPAELFHGLTADQLAQIVNWGACQAVLGPDVQVTVTPPPSCSNGLTSDFTVQVTTTRTDFTAAFTHRVINGVIPIEVVAAQSSATLSVANDAGPMLHQLWYNGCLIKETAFNACSTGN